MLIKKLLLDIMEKKSGFLKQLIPAQISEEGININEVSERINSTLLEIFPRYSFRTKQQGQDVEELFKIALKRKDENGYRFYNNELGRDEIGIRTEEELKKRITDYVEERDIDKK